MINNLSQPFNNLYSQRNLIELIPIDALLFETISYKNDTHSTPINEGAVNSDI